MRVAIIGAGNVGAMAASRIIDADLADVVLVDIVPGLARGKALDISDARSMLGSSVKIVGTEDSSGIKHSDIAVITAGLARKPGMSRDDLLKKNSEIIKALSIQIKRHCPSSIVIVVTNPVDAMSYLAMKATGFNPKKVIGMAGVLDRARFINALGEKHQAVDEDKFLMMGSHGDTMVPVSRSRRISETVFRDASEIARNRGAEIVRYLKTGSAYFAPSAAVFSMVRAALKDERSTMCASAYLEGEYREKDIYIGVPLILGSTGVKKIVEIELTDEEKSAFRKSADSIRNTIKRLK